MGCSNTKPLAAVSAPDTSPVPNPSAPANSVDPPTDAVDGDKTAVDVAVNGDSGGGPSAETKATAPNPFGDVKSVHLEEPPSGSVISHAVEPVAEDPIAEEAEAEAEAEIEIEEVMKVEGGAEDEAGKSGEGEILETLEETCPTDTSGDLPETEGETIEEVTEDPVNNEEAEEAVEETAANEETAENEEASEDKNNENENEGESLEILEDNKEKEPSEE